MVWGRTEQQQPPIIMIDPNQNNNKTSKNFLTCPQLVYDCPLLSTTSFSSSCSSLNSIQTIQTKQPDFTDIVAISKQALQIEGLRQDLMALNQKYVLQIEKFQEVEQQKAQTEHELEDLSRNLFEQANAMVSQEKKARFLIEQKLERKKKELTILQEELENEKAQYKELKNKLEQHEKNSEPLDKSQIAPINVVDRGWQDMFNIFIKVAPSTSIDLLHRASFLKLCFHMDVQPCLRSGAGFSRLAVKRLLEFLVHQSCFIEQATSFQIQYQESIRRTSFASRFRSAPGYQCSGCSSKLDKRDEMFRFKLKEQDNDWQYIDRACRNRLVAVCDFYTFVRHVQLGLQATKTIDSLFKECFKLRLAMFYARSGICTLYSKSNESFFKKTSLKKPSNKRFK